MVEWEDDFKKYIASKLSKTLGYEILGDSIIDINVNGDANYEEANISELANLYAFSIMKEEYETTKLIADELEKRNCEIKVDCDDRDKTGVINIYLKPNVTVAYVDIKMKVLPDGMVIDWEKQNY